MSTGFPFAALVGIETLKMALQLSAIDSRLSVLVRGDKGAGKTTAVRSLAALLEPGTPFINLPIGATEDRLLGGLDVEKALKGEPALKPGLLGAAHGGVLYVDEVNLLADHLADALLDAVASGVHVIEREGFSAVQPARFVMAGSMNPEEGALRPQLLDRFALAVDVRAPLDPQVRSDVVHRRLAYDEDPQAFSDRWRSEQERCSQQLASARARVASVVLSQTMIVRIAERIAEHRVASLRADLAVARGARALAALEGVDAVTDAHVDAVLPLALLHRASPRDLDPHRPPPRPSTEPDSRDDRNADDEPSAERTFASAPTSAPRLILNDGGMRAGASSGTKAAGRGVAIGARQTLEPGELDPRATLVHAVARTGRSLASVADLHERIRAPLAGTRFIFVVDSSGSHAIHERMRLVKGAIRGLLEAADGRRDEVVVIACRGASASVLVEPTPERDAIERAIEYLPTGGRTPLAHALELAGGYVTDAAVVIVVTDGHANVPTRSSDAWADALLAARAIQCRALVVDSEDEHLATGKPRELATAMRGTYVPLSELDQTLLLRVVREN